MVALDNTFEYVARVLDQVEAIGDLHGVWCSLTPGASVVGGSVSRDNLDARMLAQPGGGCPCTPIGKEVDDCMGLAVGEYRAIELAFVKCEVIDTKNAWSRV